MATLKDYEMLGELGKGSYGVVHRVRNKHDNKIYVLKQVDIGKLNLRQKKQAQAQANILKQLRSPYVVRYYHSFLQRGNLNIVMEFCQGGDLDKYMKRMMGRPMKEDQIWKFFIQICIGLRDIHHKRILHRDIKAMNIFLTKDEQIRIGDLGVAKALKTDFAITYVGTPYYLSPEMCQEKPYNEKTDIWAMGCILYQMCTGKYPFDAANQASLALKIVMGRYAPISNAYSTQMAEMIQQCLSVDPKRRPTASYILEKAYVKNFIHQKGLKMKAEEVFQKETSGIKGNYIPLGVKSKQKQQNEPPKTEMNFRSAQDEKLPENPRANEPTLKAAKWNRPVKAQIISEPVRFFDVKGQKIADKSSEKGQQKSQQKLIPPKYPPPSKRPTTKTPHVPPKIPVGKPVSARDIREQQKQKQLQRKQQLMLEQEKREQRVRQFEKNEEERRKEKLRQAEKKKKQQQERRKAIRSRSEQGDKTPKGKMEIVAPKKAQTPEPNNNLQDDTLVLPDLIDSDEQIDPRKVKKQEQAAKIVGMAQQKVSDDDLLDEFGDMKISMPAQPPKESPKKTTATLPTYNQQFSEPQQAIVEQYDPNEIMEQLEEVQPCQSSVQSVHQQMNQDNQLLIQEKTMGESQQRLKKVLEENLRRQDTIEKLIADKQTELFVSLDKEKYKELKKLVGHADERQLQMVFKGVKAFSDQKILYLFYKIMLYDSQKEECERNIHEINKRLKN